MKTQLAILDDGSRTFTITKPVSGRKPALALLLRLHWAAALVLPPLGAEAGVVFTSLYSLQPFPNGEHPAAALVQGSDGNFYGTASSGGTNGLGTVFRITTNGACATLYSFGSVQDTNGLPLDGSSPFTALVQGRDGDFYGTTSSGGTNGSNGTVFKITTNGALTTLYSFGSVRDTNGLALDGSGPSAALAQGRDGYFYGTTYGGGMNNSGTVFKITTNGTLTSTYSFTGGSDGANPSAALVQGNDGYFYGTTWGGGTNGSGTVFKISTNVALTTLYSFGSVYDTNGLPLDGSSPYAALVQGRDGNFYGTTSSGGTNWDGTVFKINTNGALTTLYAFGSVQDTNGVPLDGSSPYAALVQGRDGSFYGTTYGGGANANQYGQSYGTVFQISPTGTLTSLYSFTGDSDGAYPYGGLVEGSDGYFYGSTEYNGYRRSIFGGWFFFGGGTVFKISPNGAHTALYSFPGDGAAPNGLVQGSDGNFYGTTENGGATWAGFFGGGDGTVFQITSTGALTTLHLFTGGDDGGNPYAGMVQGSDGSFYGTTQYGGTNWDGTVFKISANGALTTLHSFGSVQDTNGLPLDGAGPLARLVEGSDGNFYGTTSSGGTNDAGTVFKISPNGALTTLYLFTGGNDGSSPSAALVQGSDGSFYGTTQYGGTHTNYGTVFKISPTATLTSLYSFTGGSDGACPYAGLVQGRDGYFYGTTSSGGTHTNYGTVFKISPTGTLTSLYSFTGGSDGANPSAALAQGRDGNFYGTTEWGGTSWNGTVFNITTNGALTTLYSFTGGNDGSCPIAALVLGSDGGFYGTTQFGGGNGGNGTVFRLTIVPEPQLTIIPSEPYVILTWPADYAGFSYSGYILQSTTNLGSSAVWTTNSSPPVVIGGENVVINAISGAHRFFRLSH